MTTALFWMTTGGGKGGEMLQKKVVEITLSLTTFMYISYSV